jgi:hypothetical protein
VSDGDSGSSNSKTTTGPVIQIPPSRLDPVEIRSKHSTTGQYLYHGKRRKDGSSPSPRLAYIAIVCAALAIGLVIWFLASPTFRSTASVDELSVPPQVPPVLPMPEEGEAAPPGGTEDTGGMIEKPQNGTQEDAQPPVPSEKQADALPSCEDQEPLAGNSEPPRDLERATEPERDPNGEAGSTSEDNDK